MVREGDIQYLFVYSNLPLLSSQTQWQDHLRIPCRSSTPLSLRTLKSEKPNLYRLEHAVKAINFRQ